MDIDELKKIHIEPRYEITQVREEDRNIFRHHASAVLYCAVASWHRRSSLFNADVRRVYKKWKSPKTHPKDAAALEQLLWNTCRDKALMAPWKATVPKLRVLRGNGPTAELEPEDEYFARVDATRAEWLRLMQELHDAMSGKRPCEVVVVQDQN